MQLGIMAFVTALVLYTVQPAVAATCASCLPPGQCEYAGCYQSPSGCGYCTYRCDDPEWGVYYCDYITCTGEVICLF
jgi:hypothetical protein